MPKLPQSFKNRLTALLAAGVALWANGNAIAAYTAIDGTVMVNSSGAAATSGSKVEISAEGGVAGGDAKITIGDNNDPAQNLIITGGSTGSIVSTGDVSVSGTAASLSATSGTATISGTGGVNINTSGNGATALGSTNSGTTVGGTLGVAGAASFSAGIDNNSGGLTEAGAISGVTTINASNTLTVTGGGANITGNTNITGALSASSLNNNSGGITNAGAVSGVTTLNASNTLTVTAGGANITGGINNNAGGITNAGTLSGITTINASNTLTITSGGANITGLTTINGALSASSLNNNSGGITNAGAVSGVSTLTTSGAANIGGALTVTTGGASITGGIDNNSGGVTEAGAVSGVTSLAVSSSSGNTLSVNDSKAEMTFSTTSKVTLTNNSAVISVGNKDKLIATATSTTIKGGTGTTTLTLDDTGATFDTGGSAARIMGVADPVNDTDAVNKRYVDSLTTGVVSGEVERQLNAKMPTINAGIASVAALAGIPEAMPWDRVSFGMGVGSHAGQNAVAMGVKANLTRRIRVGIGAGHSKAGTTWNAGIGSSW